MRPAEVYRNAILASMYDDLIEHFEAQAAALKTRSWVARAQGVNDCIVVLKALREKLHAPEVQKDKES